MALTNLLFTVYCITRLFVRSIRPLHFICLAPIGKAYYKKTGLIPWYALDLFRLQAPRVREFKGLCELVA